MTYRLYNEDYLTGVSKIQDNSIDLILADPPYGLGKDYGNDSDKLKSKDLVEWTIEWLNMSIPKLKDTGSLYIFTTWKNSPEIFCYLKQHLTMKNEIIWDRRVPSMGGSTRSYSSVHDTIGFFVKTKNYYFDLDAIRVPYDEETKKQRSRSKFIGHKWLELGCNPKDVWSIPRLHKESKERQDHPTQKPVELLNRIIKASCPVNGTVLDPFAGSGSTLESAVINSRNVIGFEINHQYCDLIETRMSSLLNKLTQG